MISPLLLLVALQQQPAQAGMKVVVKPLNPVVTVGDSLRLSGEVVDAGGRPGCAQSGGSAVRSRVAPTAPGMVHAGSHGTLVVFAVPSVPGSAPGAPTETPVRMVTGPAASVTISPEVTRLVAGQHLLFDATVAPRTVTCVMTRPTGLGF